MHTRTTALRNLLCRVGIGAIVLAAVLLQTQLWAQVLNGTLIGNVTDSSRAAVPNARVRIINTGTGHVVEIQSNGEGIYLLTNVTPGTYEITFSADGFRTITTKGVVVNANTTVRSDVQFEIGSTSESVEVRAEAFALQTDTADIRGQIARTELSNTPVPLKRNFQSLLATIPGFSPASGGAENMVNPTGALTMKANGTNTAAITYRVDGTISRDAWTPNQSDYNPTIGAIETVNVVTGSFDAEQGLAAGAAVNVQIKSGTNELHGTGFEFHNDQHLKARPYFLPRNQDKSKRVLNQFGGTLGGPIKKNKLFYFGSYEETRDRESVFAIGSVPTAAMRKGDFSASNTQIYDPLSGGANGTNRLAFPNKSLPSSRVSPIIQKLVDLTPLPNLNSDSMNNFFANGPLSTDSHHMDGKVSWNATQKFTLSARVGALILDQNTPTRFEKLEGNTMGSSGDMPGITHSNLVNITVAGVYTLSSSLVVDAYFGYGRRNASRTPPYLDQNLGLDLLGIPGTNGPTREYGGWPTFSVNSYDSLGRSQAFTPTLNSSESAQAAANVAWIKGKHNVRFGFDYWRNVLRLAEPTGNPGEFTFAQGVTGAAGASTNNYNSYASFLLGLPSGETVRRIYQTGTGVSPATSLYIRDTWQATRNLTLNAGVRWDYFSVPFRDTGEGFPIYNAQTNVLAMCGYGNLPKNCGFSAGKRYFSPRVGLAYRVADHFVVRAGYALSWDPIDISRNTIKWYPSLVTSSYSGASSFDFANTIDKGLPAQTAPQYGDGNIVLPLNVQIETFDPNYRRPYVQSWNLTLERQFKGWVAQAGYVATRSMNINSRFDLNYSTVGGGKQSEVLFARFGREGVTRNTTTLGWNGKYDSLQTTLQKQFSSGVATRFSYTFSKTFWPYGSDNGMDAGSSNNNPLYWYRILNTLASSDRPHSLTGLFSAPLPFGRTKRWAQTGLASRLFGGWQANGLLTAFSGPPLTITAAATSLNAPGNTQTADLVKSNVKILGTPDSWFDPTAYRQVTDVRFGTSGFNQIRAPGLVNVDASIFRDFAVKERFRIQFRAEMFNVSNTPHFGAPGTNVNNMQLNGDGSIRTLGGFSQITSVQDTGRAGIDERMTRLGLTLSF